MNHNGSSRKYPPPATASFRPATDHVSGGTSRMSAPPSRPRTMNGRSGAPGTPYNGCSTGKIEASYSNPHSTNTSIAHAVSGTTLNVGAR